tara:strand:- start:359 stop:937 length:579 start_codon:yes stop_codon:yes gene_type:complete
MKTEVRDRILDIGISIIAKKGYNGIGIMEILNEANTPKGSFYHYFKSKEDFGVQVINRYSEDTLKYINSFLEDNTINPVQRIFALFENVQKIYVQKEFNEGCLLGNSSTELGGQNIHFASLLNNEFLKMEKLFAKCLTQAKNQGELQSNMSPDELAGFIVNSWEGVILRMKVTKTLDPMKNFLKILRTQILV